MPNASTGDSITLPDDADALALLLNAGTHSDVRQTHISVVALTERSAYKRLKPVRFDFLDFSTREGRYAHLANEARLNRRLAAGVYRQLIPLWESQGRWKLAGSGPPDDWLLAMERLPQEATLESALERGTLDESQFDRAVEALVAFLKNAERTEAITANGDSAVIRGNLVDDFRVLNAAGENGILDAAGVERLRSRQFQSLILLDDELRRRQRDGWIRDGHGDLRAEHVYLTTPIRIVDCIAFNHRLRWIDTADDVAFLATDLVRLGGENWAKRLSCGYRERAGDPISDDLFSFYCSYRFAVRSKVAVLRGRELEGREQAATFRDGQRLLSLANDALAARRPWFVAVCGLSGTGKTTVAAALADVIGARRVSSDVTRKELHGLRPTERPASDALYDDPATEATYREVSSRARACLAGGTGVVLDATFLRKSDRNAVMNLGHEFATPVLFVECRCPESEIARRLAARAAHGLDASDATLDVWRRQRSISDGYAGLPPGDHLVVETTGRTSDVVDEIVTRLKDR